jgi:hypothetical protein
MGRETQCMKKFKDDYDIVTTTDENGNEKKTAVYRGNLFEISLDDQGIVRFRRNCFLLFAVIAVLHLSGGFVANPGMFQFFVALPYVCAFFPLIYLVLAMMRLPKEKRQYRRDEIGLSFNRLKISSFILLILLGMGVLGELVFLLFFSLGIRSVTEYIFLAIELLTAAAAYFLITLQRQILIKPSAGQP